MSTLADASASSRLPRPRPELVAVIEKAQELPVVDMGDFVAGKPGATEQLAADIRYIQETLGFYMIVNYGFDPAIIDEATQEAFKLFRLPQEILLKSEHVDHMQGYWAPRTFTNMRPGFENEQTNVRKAPISGWAFLRERDTNDPKVLSNMRHRTMNKWPDPAAAPGFRPAMERYQAAMVDLGMRLIRVYALSLGLPEDYFDADFAEGEWYNRINYLAGSDSPAGTIGQTAHSDHSFLTLLPISKVAGLQVRTSDDSGWIDARYIPGAIAINTGEWLNRKSNGLYPATPHRVLEPHEERISMPFFIDPRDEATSEPVPTMSRAEGPNFPVMGWHAFFLSYIDGYTNAKQ